MTIIPLFLNDVSGSEIFLIMLVVLMFFGSKSIPGIAKTLGKTMYEIRNASSELQNEIKKSGVDIQKDMNISSLLKDSAEEIAQPMDQMLSDIDNTVHYGSVNPVKPTAGNPVDAVEENREAKVENTAIEAQSEEKIVVSIPENPEAIVSKTEENQNPQA